MIGDGLAPFFSAGYFGHMFRIIPDKNDFSFAAASGIDIGNLNPNLSI
jgi:hypothetical protein